MHWEPDERKRSKPEQDEADEVVDGASKSDLSGQRRTGSERGPDGQDHEVDTFTSDPALDAIPDTRRLSDIGSRRNIRYTYHAIRALFKTGQRDPQIPKEALLMTGNEMW